MRKMILLGLMFIVMYAAGCTSNDDHSAQDGQFLRTVPYPDSTEILNKLEIDEGMLYFYKDETGIRHSFVSNDGNIRLNSDVMELDSIKGVNWAINEDPNLSIIILAGVISNKEIQEISLKQNGIENDGIIMEPKKELRFWYAIFDRVVGNGVVSEEPFKIEGLSDEGKVLWEDEVFIKYTQKWGY
ncbi:hypothetical protein [Bacillus marasmi]|uniref:hypothetical protein n=1 Tax=Bacillus marasmi TaxID=1926279 RepID=UPI0011CBE23E|nr:hypothetical protein [Bacillus marasmi]